jgi:hypothetical protein
LISYVLFHSCSFFADIMHNQVIWQHSCLLNSSKISAMHKNVSFFSAAFFRVELRLFFMLSHNSVGYSSCIILLLPTKCLYIMHRT